MYATTTNLVDTRDIASDVAYYHANHRGSRSGAHAVAALKRAGRRVERHSLNNETRVLGAMAFQAFDFPAEVDTIMSPAPAVSQEELRELARNGRRIGLGSIPVNTRQVEVTRIRQNREVIKETLFVKA